MWRQILALILTAALTLQLPDLTRKSYLELLQLSPTLKFSEKDYDSAREKLEKDKESEQDRLEKAEDKLNDQIKASRKQLDSLNKASSRDTASQKDERQRLHCQILDLEGQLRDTETERKQGVPILFENRFAKLDLIRNWPTRKQEIERLIATGQARNREYGDIDDIGIRIVGENQQDDIKTGEDAIREMKSLQLMPKEIQDKELSRYIETLAATLAKNSDLKIPLKVTVLDTEEINAFALPGAFLFVNLGLIDKAENESELAGVLAHEIAHAAARHGAKLSKRATIANIFMQAAQVAAVIFTGGVAGIGTYYALQYGFYGLGMVLDLTLLGVSRDFEMEADQLGVQYTWHAGIDPRGFVTFFDKMATKEGYVKSTSFFRTHPPFFDRIVTTFSELEFLPPKDQLRMDSSDFALAKKRVTVLMSKSKVEKENKPTLHQVPECPSPGEKTKK
ncbi:MAG TPA: M48 family metalloprotease [Terriglobia bacterium]|nr:M48 family metalloprotease [Terriglobia bacterium]